MGVDLPLVPVIVGPTAVGKTALVVELAGLIPLEVISADSRQIYRKLDIGTAKPTASQLDAVPHHLINLLDPGDPYSAGRFRKAAIGAIAAVTPDRVPVIVGGTGLYVKVLAGEFFEQPPLPEPARTRLRKWLAGKGNRPDWAARLDPAYRPGGIHRTIRAIEVPLLTGRPLSWWQERNRSDPAIDPWYIRLTMDRKKLVERIELRIDGMLAEGLVEETRGLIDAGFDRNAAGFNAVGYRDVIRYLDGSISHEEMRNQMIVSTRQYAKRQETWFRNQLPEGEVLVLDALDGAERNAGLIARSWDERSFT